MKNIARSRVTSFALVCAMVLTMLMGICMVPAYAAEPEPLELIPVTDVDAVEITAVGSGESLLEDDSLVASDIVIGDIAEPAATTEIRNTASITKVVVYPLVSHDGDETMYRVENIYRTKIWTDGRFSESLLLSPAQTAAFKQQAINEISSYSEYSQYTWTVVGWEVTSTFVFTAQKPLRVEYTPSKTCLEGTEKRTIKVTSKNTELKITHTFAPPENDDSYYNVRVSGAFYFTYTSGNNAGKEGSTIFSGGVGFNSSLA